MASPAENPYQHHLITCKKMGICFIMKVLILPFPSNARTSSFLDPRHLLLLGLLVGTVASFLCRSGEEKTNLFV